MDLMFRHMLQQLIPPVDQMTHGWATSVDGFLRDQTAAGDVARATNLFLQGDQILRSYLRFWDVINRRIGECLSRRNYVQMTPDIEALVAEFTQHFTEVRQFFLMYISWMTLMQMPSILSQLLERIISAIGWGPTDPEYARYRDFVDDYRSGKFSMPNGQLA